MVREEERRMERKPNLIFVASSWLLVTCVLGLLSSHWITNAPSLALAQATPEMAPIAYLPCIANNAPGDWLSYVNYYRALGELPPVTENPTWSDGCWKHARYMVKND